MPLPKIETPRYTLTVPSSGNTVQYRPYLVKEEKILMLALESEDDTDMIDAIKRVIESCTDGQLNDTNMTMFDLEFFFTNLRAKSVGESSTVIIPCPKCEKRSEITIDLSTVSVNVPQNDDYYLRSIDDQIKVRMRFPTISQTMNLIKSYKNDVDLAYNLILEAIAEIYYGDEVYDTNDYSRDELIEFIESLSTTQFNSIKNFIEDSPIATIRYHHHCTSCGEKSEETLDGLSNFFE